MNLRTIWRGALALALFAPSLALAQGVPVFQSGTVTPHHLLKSSGNGLQRDVGGLTGDVSGRGVSPFSITDSLGLGLCSNTAVTGGQHYAFCLGHDSDGNALLSVTANGGAAERALKLSINGASYDLPSSGAGSGNVTGPLSSTVGNLAFFNATNGQVLKDNGWTDDGTQLIGPLGRNFTLRPTGAGGGAFQVGGTGGPLVFAQQGYEDTLIVQAKPGSLPSTDTTNLQVFSSTAGGKAFINFSDTSLSPPNESRMIIGYNGPDFWISNVIAGSGTSRNICVLDGKGAEFTSCFVPRSGGAGTYPSFDLGQQVPLRMTNSTLAEQEILKVDTNDNLLVAGGSVGDTLKTIVLQKPIATVHSAPATLSSCGGGTPVITGDATAGFVTVGTGTVTACTVGFGITYGTAPRAILLTGFGTGSKVLSISAKSTTSFTIAASADMASQSFSYMVIQ